VLETSVPGVFTIGDVRCGSVKSIGAPCVRGRPLLLVRRDPGVFQRGRNAPHRHIVVMQCALRDVAAQRGWQRKCL